MLGFIGGVIVIKFLDFIGKCITIKEPPKTCETFLSTKYNKAAFPKERQGILNLEI